MKKLVFSSFNFAPIFAGAAFNMLQTTIDEGHDVYFINCLKSFDTCGFNSFGLKYMCEICNYRHDKAMRSITGAHHVHSLKHLYRAEDFLVASEFLNNRLITKDIIYDQFDVGESVLSSYISKTRDRDIELSENRSILYQLALQSIVVYRAMVRFLADNKIDEIILFNGRWDYYRAVFRAANKLGIPCLIYENLRTGGYLEFFDNAFPHIIKLRQKNTDDCWENCQDQEYKHKVAKDFFERRQRGEGVNSKSYVTKQAKSLLPDGADRNKKIWVLFNNSDDEVAAIGGDEYVNPYFESQIEGIEYVVNLVGKEFAECQLILRVHPNLEGLEFDYVKRIYALEGKYSNVIIVRAESPVDSYSLLDIADKVITFGSSIGIEANYWGKPVILLAKSFYSLADVAYSPNNINVIPELLRSELPLKDKVNSEKIAFYIMCGGVKAKYYDYNAKTKGFYFKGVRIDHLPMLIKNYFRALKLLKIKNKEIKYVSRVN